MTCPIQLQAVGVAHLILFANIATLEATLTPRFEVMVSHDGSSLSA
jgi:hypothetical protein